jgi:hypothetical protein
VEIARARLPCSARHTFLWLGSRHALILPHRANSDGISGKQPSSIPIIATSAPTYHSLPPGGLALHDRVVRKTFDCTVEAQLYLFRKKSTLSLVVPLTSRVHSICSKSSRCSKPSRLPAFCRYPVSLEKATPSLPHLAGFPPRFAGTGKDCQ